MSKALNIVLVEDVEADAILLRRQLAQAGRDCAIRRVQSEPELRAALREVKPDIVISDFSLPGFDGLRALEIAAQLVPDTPFVFVSGTIGEARAIDSLHRGATDYVLKSNLKHLPAAVDRALRESALRRERRESEQQLRATVETSQDWVWETDIDGRFRFCSASVASILGFEPEALLHQDFRSLLYPDQAADGLLPSPAQARLTGVVARWRTADGEFRWLERNVVAIVNEHGERTGFRGADRDITARREQEARLRRLTRSYRMLSSTGSAILRLRSRDELLDEVCRIAVTQGGYERVYISMIDGGANLPRIRADVGSDRLQTLKVDDAAVLGETATGILEQVLHSAAPAVLNDLTPAVSADYRALAALPLSIDGTPIGVMAFLSSQTGIFDEPELAVLLELTANVGFALQYLAKDQTVQFLSYFDTLTGLAKRPLFCERLARTLQSDQAVDRARMVIALDIQKLGAINDSFGRYMGDRLLEKVAARLKEAYEGSECLAYLGGGTFAVALATEGDASATSRLSRNPVAPLFVEPFLLEGQAFRVTARGGIALYPQDAQAADTLLQNAEAALKAARDGNEKSLPYALVTQRPTPRSVSLEARLAGALEREEFQLHYQPKVDIANGRIIGFEALLRWNDVHDGFVSPACFIPLLERSGAIVEVGDWVLLQAAAEIRAWQAAGHLPTRIAVNVSPLQLRRRDFVDRVLQVSSPLGTRAGIDIEITESMLMLDMEQSIRKLASLREAGIGVAIDDFGTGYSSLRLLGRLPVNVLKIDRSFVVDALERGSSLTLISTIVSLAHAFGMSTVAEGVETVEQLRMLRQIGCDAAQGYLLARPAPTAAILPLMARLSQPLALAEPGWDIDPAGFDETPRLTANM